MIAILIIAFFIMGFFFRNAIESVHQEFDFYGRSARDLFLAVAFAWIAFLLSGCTVAPRQVTSGSISIGDNGSPNAGILSKVVDAKGVVTGFYVDQGYVDNYLYLVKTYGKELKPPVTDATGTVHALGVWYIDAKHAGIYAQLVGVEINGS